MAGTKEPKAIPKYARFLLGGGAGLQNMKVINGKPEYSGNLEVFFTVVRREGIFALWKGFTPYYARLGPHTVLTFIFLEQMTAMYRKIVLGEEGGGPSSL